MFNPYDQYMMGALMGDMFDDDAQLGAALARLPTRVINRVNAARQTAAAPSMAQQRAAATRAIAQQISPGAFPGTPPRGAREWPLGLGSFTFTNAAGLTATTLVGNPQRVFQGQRLVVSTAKTAGAAGILVTITSLEVGAQNQVVDPGQALPAEGFEPGAFHTVLDLDPCEPGIRINLGIGISAVPGAGETVSVSAMIIGTSLG